MVVLRAPAAARRGVGGFLIGYGVFRFAVEFTREPDRFLGLLALGFSMGQWLSAPMIVAGVALLVWAYSPRPTDPTASRQPLAEFDSKTRSAAAFRQGYSSTVDHETR